MFCKHCGKKLEDGDQFCIRCGTKKEAIPNKTDIPPAYRPTADVIAVNQPPVYTQYTPPTPHQKSILGLVAIITAAAVVVICTASYFLFFTDRPAGPAVQNEEEGFSEVYIENSPDFEVPAESYSAPADVQQTPQVAVTDYSTVERPDLSDFLWYLEGVYFDGPPQERTAVSDFSELTGGWKAYIWYDPNNVADAAGWDYLNIYIYGSADSATVMLDWYMTSLHDSDTMLDMTGIDDTVLFGDYSLSILSVGDPGYSFQFTDFYYMNGKQYGLGYMFLQSGEETYVALVRP